MAAMRRDILAACIPSGGMPVHEMHAMAVKTLKIDGMSCGHCVAAVTRALESMPGVTVKTVEIGTATIEAADSVTPAQLAAAIDDAGFTLVTAPPA